MEKKAAKPSAARGAVRKPQPSEPERRGSRAALWALLFPLFFTVVIAFGVFLMAHKRMAIFRPGPSGENAEHRVTAVKASDQGRQQ